MRRTLLLAALLALLGLGKAGPQVKSGDPIPGQWIVTFNSATAKAEYARVAAAEGKSRAGSALKVVYTFDINGEFTGEVVQAPARVVKRLRRIAGLALEQDRWVVLDDSRGTNVTSTGGDASTTGYLAQATGTMYWGLDRVDQRNLPLDQKYYYLDNAQGQGVTVYVMDTGIRTTHQEFQNRARVVGGITGIVNTEGWDDLNGHGTHVAGTVAGRNTGVAKQVSIRGFKVADRNGAAPISYLINGFSWIVADCKKLASKRCIISLSIGASKSDSLNAAATAAYSAGLVVVVAAGNTNGPACNNSPASAKGTITVGATSNTDRRASFSSYDGCVDIFAPGVDIFSCSRTSNTAGVYMSGTSMATPHVSGTAAIIWSKYPSYTNAQVTAELLNTATPNKVIDPMGSLNRLVYTP